MRIYIYIYIRGLVLGLELGLGLELDVITLSKVYIGLALGPKRRGALSSTEGFTADIHH